LWMSEAFKDKFEIDQSCLANKDNTILSHDNLFHSLLGMLDINTRERDPALDIFATCKAAQKVAQN
jgi:lipid A ethanolaminephosphotransferase